MHHSKWKHLDSFDYLFIFFSVTQKNTEKHASSRKKWLMLHMRLGECKKRKIYARRRRYIINGFFTHWNMFLIKEKLAHPCLHFFTIFIIQVGKKCKKIWNENITTCIAILPYWWQRCSLESQTYRSGIESCKDSAVTEVHFT